MKLMKKLMIFVATLAIVFSISACGALQDEDTIVIGEASWDSNKFHNQIARILIEEGYGVEVDLVTADTSVMVASLKADNMDLTMELWSDNIPSYQDDIDAGDYVELSVNFDDNEQGLYIPTYLQEQYPGLQTVQDLPDYVHLFPDLDSDKGLILAGPNGWSATSFLKDKMVEYNLDDDYKLKTLETATLYATLADAYANEDPWVGYNWTPTWVSGVYDLTLLEDSEYNEEDFANGIGEFPSVDVNVVAHPDLETNYPEVVEFLRNYETSSELTSSALAYMQENDVDAEAAAIWFLLENEDLWSQWVTTDAYDSTMEYLNAQ